MAHAQESSNSVQARVGGVLGTRIGIALVDDLLAQASGESRVAHALEAAIRVHTSTSVLTYRLSCEILDKLILVFCITSCKWKNKISANALVA